MVRQIEEERETAEFLSIISQAIQDADDKQVIKLVKGTLAFASRVANYNQQTEIREAKVMINHMMDTMGFTTELQSAFISYFLRTQISQAERDKRREGGRGVAQIPLALENLRLKLEAEQA